MQSYSGLGERSHNEERGLWWCWRIRTKCCQKRHLVACVHVASRLSDRERNQKGAHSTAICSQQSQEKLLES